LFEHETISTTIEKAKEVKPFAEKLITLAKKGNLPARRRAISLLGNRDIVAYEEGEAVRKGTVVGKLFSELGPRYLDRPGGYTRIIRLSLKRLGDNGQLVLLQLVGADETMEKKPKKRSRKKIKETVEAGPVAEEQDVTEAREDADVELVEEGEDTPDAQDSEEESSREEK
jgi:large subunit ribosomal protein L17